ncbi:Crp/Fnr family transcriptional regulator [Desulfoplanes formicivorans]|uniref:Transcriptional regulator n=1 Tax=Desulfoplanes formicivorans TaxID=1592317 RepID=A0A194AJ13_9BACT|nr:Crp/Fnr family transcriptional regulator [Desulfoplanes formicivorans]GAU08734.1 transcriptional regulator [Desulfoplanes formicivorans]
MHTETIIDFLTRVDLFGGLQEEYLAFLAEIAREMHVTKGQSIFWAGDAGTGFYLVKTGRVKIFRTSFSGKEHILHVFGSGEAFGEVAVFAGDRFPASAVTLEPSRLLFFPRDAFRKLLAREPDLALQMLALLSRRLRSFVNKVEELSLKEVPARLASHFLLLAAAGQTDTFTLDLSKTELSKYLGTIPETLSRTLRKMESQGLVRGNGACIRILDRPGLEEVAEGLVRL